MKEMSTIKFPNQTETYEIVDAVARQDIAEKSNIGHTHTRSEITDFAHEHDERYYTETEVDNMLLNKSDVSHSHDVAEVLGAASEEDLSNLQTQVNELLASVVTVYSGASTDPSTNLGEDGDIYLVTE